MKKLLTDSPADLHTDLNKLRYGFNADISEVKYSIQKLEDSTEFTHSKEQVKEESKKHTTDIELLHQKVAQLELKLKEEVERNTNLEQYTRRENLRLNKIPESEDEKCYPIIYDVISSLGINISQIRLHAVYRVRTKAKDRCRPIIARFVCREDIIRTAFGLKKVISDYLSQRVYNGRLHQSLSRRKRKLTKAI